MIVSKPPEVFTVAFVCILKDSGYTSPNPFFLGMRPFSFPPCHSWAGWFSPLFESLIAPLL